MTMQSQIKEHMPVKCADGQNHGEVDEIDGAYFKLTRDDFGIQNVGLAGIGLSMCQDRAARREGQLQPAKRRV